MIKIGATVFLCMLAIIATLGIKSTALDPFLPLTEAGCETTRIIVGQDRHQLWLCPIAVDEPGYVSRKIGEGKYLVCPHHE